MAARDLEPYYEEWVSPLNGQVIRIKRNATWTPKGRFDDNFVSPVDGSIITSQRKLREHNLRNNVVQWESGTEEEFKRKTEEIRQRASGEADVPERKQAIADAIKKLENQ